MEPNLVYAIAWWIGICFAAGACALIMLWLAKRMLADEETVSLQEQWKLMQINDSIHDLDARIAAITGENVATNSILRMKSKFDRFEMNEQTKWSSIRHHVQDMDARLRIIENALKMLEERQNGAASVNKAKVD